MPRQSRIHFPGSLHHVMARGIHGQNIFLDKKDFDQFTDRLADLFVKSDQTCYAWALLNNHFHLLIKSGDTSISSLMRRLLTGHAVYFNRRHKRFGHLFQNRFKSILCQEDIYFLQLVRYIHLNPLRTGAVKTIKTLNKFKYAGHAYLLGEQTNEWQNIRYPLQWFGKQKNKSKQKYLEYVKEGIVEGKRTDLTGGGLLRTAGGWKGLKELRKKKQSTLSDERMLGDSDFVDEVLNQKEKNTLTQRTDKDTYTLDQLAHDVCAYFNVPQSDVRSADKQRHLRQAKILICYIAIRMLNLKGVDIARYLNISKSAVSKLVTGYQPDDLFNQFVEIYLK